jgi:hypothetical protein
MKPEYARAKYATFSVLLDRYVAEEFPHERSSRPTVAVAAV